MQSPMNPNAEETFAGLLGLRIFSGMQAIAECIRRFTARSIFSEAALIIMAGLAAMQLLGVAASSHEGESALREMMLTIGVERDIADAVALLDRLPVAERATWLAGVVRPGYRLVLDGEAQGGEPASMSSRQLAAAVTDALHPLEVVKIGQAGRRDGLQIQIRLSDGSMVVVHTVRPDAPVQSWTALIYALQIMLLGACAWLVARRITRPLMRLAAAANDMGLDLKARRIDEEGASEVADAARAFNTMQRRISGSVADRVEVLAAISHDLQMPITRMRLRAEMMSDQESQAKFLKDLDAMNALVKEGVAYARTLHGVREIPLRIDPDALLESMVADYEDAGRSVVLEGRLGEALVTSPVALRRILLNLIDNALKFANLVRVRLRSDGDRVVISVLDNGPGIPAEELDAVLRPFYRIEGSHGRNDNGTGLGLAVAHQLAVAIGARLSLRNRLEGGLEARLTMTAGSAR